MNLNVHTAKGIGEFLNKRKVTPRTSLVAIITTTMHLLIGEHDDVVIIIVISIALLNDIGKSILSYVDDLLNSSLKDSML
jgi:hypothetical protein